MLFNSVAFFVFFPAVVAAYFLVPHRVRWALLLAASYVFYGWWKPAYLVFLLTSTTVDYLVALWLARVEDVRRRRALLAASLVANFGLLFVFKYSRFFASSAALLLGRAGVDARLELPDLVLPIGISFYTFQTVSYVIDVYRREREPETHFGRFALFVAFFPHLVAGPIVRAAKLLPQFRVERRWEFDRVVSGLQWMLWGFFKKCVVADRAAALVNAVYDHPERFQGGTIVVATYAFAFQIYCDFSGYSDIAIGSARVLGIELTKNFDHPYGSASVVEFWRRWHISLSTWFRDYVFVPLGGSRVGPVRRSANLMAVFLLSGLWHGASWTFVAWGAYHGVLIVATLAVASLWGRLFGKTEVRRPFRIAGRAIGVVLTFHLVCLGWILFRARDLSHALTVVSRLSVSGASSVASEIISLGIAPADAMKVELVVLAASVVAIECVHAWLRTSHRRSLPIAARWFGWATLSVWVVLTAVQTHAPFIYFQF